MTREVSSKFAPNGKNEMHSGVVVAPAISIYRTINKP